MLWRVIVMMTKDEVLKLKQGGLRNSEIAALLKVSRQYVSHICQMSQDAGTKARGHLGDGLLTVGAASRLLGVHEATIRRWSDKGLIPSFRIEVGRRDRRFRTTDLIELTMTNGVADEEAQGKELVGATVTGST
jgi:excisionase family DNA binding protein